MLRRARIALCGPSWSGRRRPRAHLCDIVAKLATLCGTCLAELSALGCDLSRCEMSNKRARRCGQAVGACANMVAPPTIHEAMAPKPVNICPISCAVALWRARPILALCGRTLPNVWLQLLGCSFPGVAIAEIPNHIFSWRTIVGQFTVERRSKICRLRHLPHRTRCLRCATVATHWHATPLILDSSVAVSVCAMSASKRTHTHDYMGVGCLRLAPAVSAIGRLTWKRLP